MDLNQQKEQFSITYVRAVVSVAGYSTYRPEVDDDSIDLGIAAKGLRGRLRSPRLELQLKSTSTGILDDTAIRYPLKIKNYDDLRLTNAVPRILVVLLLSSDNPTDWLTQSDEELCMKACGYWISLRGMSETKNTTTVTIQIPSSNRFTVGALKSIMEQIGEGVAP